MKTLSDKLEILREGADDSLNLLEPAAMDRIEGGGFCIVHKCDTVLDSYGNAKRCIWYFYRKKNKHR